MPVLNKITIIYVMQVFELYFNPKEETKVSESFHYKPKNVYERKIGRLYMVGELPDAEKKDAPLLQNIFHLAKEVYYKDTSLPPERALKKTLKRVNGFIREKDYSGKINIALFSSKNFSLYMGKSGEMKLLLLNNGKTKDVSKELEDSPSGLFQNMISGKMKKNDKLVVLTPEVYRFFVKGKILEEISKEPLSEKISESIASTQKEKFPQTSGVSLIIDHSISLKEGGKKLISGERKKRFSFKEVFWRALSPFSKLKFPKLNLSPKRLPGPELKLSSVKTAIPAKIRKKSLLLPLLLFGVVIIGVLTIGVERSVRLGKNEEVIQNIKENALTAQEKNNLFMLEKAFFELKALKEEDIVFTQETEEFYFSLKEKLNSFSFSEEITETELIGSVKKINPERIIFANESLYLFSSDSPKLSVLSIETGEEFSHTLPIKQGVDYASFSGNNLIFFSVPNTITYMEEEQISQTQIELLEPRNEFVSLSSFFGNPYLLDDQGNIFRYDNKTPSKWIKEDSKRAEGGLSMAIDRSIFVLTREGKIHRYYTGKLEETFSPFIFPSLKGAKKIYSVSPDSPLFILDPGKNRVIVVEKNEKNIKQFSGDILKGIKDITVTPDGKKMYLLVNRKVHLLEL